jgi:hypothetical protein
MDVNGQHHTPTAVAPVKNPDNQLNTVMGGPQSRSGWIEQKKYILSLPGFKHRILQPVVSRKCFLRKK